MYGTMRHLCTDYIYIFRIYPTSAAQGIDGVAVAYVHVEVVAPTAGGEVQVHIASYGTVAVVGAGPSMVSAFTSTGITAPVARRNARWPSTIHPHSQYSDVTSSVRMGPTCLAATMQFPQNDS